MKRYCKKCDKEFEFKIGSMSDLEDLVCPVCGEKVDKNSRADKGDMDSAAKAIGNTAHTLYNLSFIFYLVLAIIGIAAYFLHATTVLYVATGITLAAFILQYITGTVVFVSGIIFVPIGAVAGYFIIGSLEGASLGVHIVFAARHIIRDIIFSILWRIIGMGK